MFSDAVTKVQRKTENMLMIHILATKKTYRRFEIESVGLVFDDQNLADASSKLQYLRRSRIRL